MEEEKKPEEATAEKPKDRIEIRDITPEGAAKAKDVRYTKRFFMDWLDEDDVKQSGEFTIKRPNIEERARIGTMMAELREDKPPSSIDRNTALLHEWMAVCSVCVIQSPPWFNTKMYDSEPMQRAYLEVLAFQQSFLKPVGK